MDQSMSDAPLQAVSSHDDDTAQFQKNFPRDFIELFVNMSGQKVLNVGSGPGRDALFLKEKGKDIVCLDASEKMVKMSTELGLTSIVGDFMKLPFPDTSFDAVWAYASLLHVPKSEMGNAFREISRVLKEDGTFGLGLVYGKIEEYQQSMGEGAPRLFTHYEEWEVRRLAREHGFSSVYFSSFKPGPQDFMHFIFRKASKEDLESSEEHD